MTEKPVSPLPASPAAVCLHSFEESLTIFVEISECLVVHGFFPVSFMWMVSGQALSHGGELFNAHDLRTNCAGLHEMEGK